MLVEKYSTKNDGVTVTTTSGRIRLQTISPTVMRVQFTGRDAFAARESLAVLPQQSAAPVVADLPDRLIVSGGRLVVSIDKACGAFTWSTVDGDLLFREPHDGRDTKLLDEIDVMLTYFDAGASHRGVQSADGMKVVTEGGDSVVDRTAYATTLRLEFSAEEAIYGLGQHEEGILNYRGHTQDLYQENMKVAVPVIVSTRGYAIVWDSYSVAQFEDGPGGAEFRTNVDDDMDFYVVLGPDFDVIIAGLRELTGRVPMLPRWSLGYLQSKERYTDAQELLDVVREHRRRHIPIDCIVQDWKTWPGDLWGQKSFDPSRYPDPEALCIQLHAENVRLMVSIWPNMQGDGPNQLEMRKQGFLLGDDSTYDARQEDARTLYWQQTQEGYFRFGVDAWWADCTEPFEADWKGAVQLDRAQRMKINVDEQKKYLDPEYVNSYSLLHSKGIYQGQRAADPGKRVLLLTRSASLGQQRYGAVTWSGDISATWQTLRRQIADGLNFCLTGNPRWNFDIGAFFVGSRDDLWFWKGDFPGGVDDLGYRELYVRWLQTGTFLPQMRAHGTETPREPWRFGEPGDDTYDTIVAFIRLRYRLLPYLYSLHAWETSRHYTSMRALAFDFRHDINTHDIDDQFMLGPALMVCPVTAPMQFGPGSRSIGDSSRSRRVYLPAGSDWYDFWTGEKYSGGQQIEMATPLEIVPLLVRAGSILPLGPVVEHTEASAQGTLELRVYPGGDSTFELYEDAGDGYGYEGGECAATELRWDDQAGRVHLGARIGQYPGMTATRSTRLVVVGPGVGVGHDVTTTGPLVELTDQAQVIDPRRKGRSPSNS
jgi:alpha-D-xyloside xylohydrolase